jgi:F-type H+-transporting ATPase subunit a
VAAGGATIDPIHQFQVNEIVPIHIGGLNLSLTNVSLFMVITLGVILGIMLLGTAGRALVPGRLQSIAEMFYEFIADLVRSTMGESGMKFFPFVMSLFLFVLVANFLGLIPGTYTVTSQIIVTFALAMVVILTVFIYGLMKHGTHFFGLFVPSGVPKPLLALLTPIEVISFLSRPISLAMRLFANMLAGHIALKVFAGFILMMFAAGGIGYVLWPLSLLMIVALTALEFLVAGLQAFVFAVLTTIYLNDALHPGH